jgi:site-specific DNA recombinase
MARKTTPKVIKAQEKLALKTDCTALYIRVSTEKQVKEGYSLDAQQAKLLAYCVDQGWNVCSDDHIYVDRGISGKSIDGRDHFKAMLQAAKAGSISRVVVTKLDRIARNLKELLDIIDELKGYGCDLVILDKQFDTSTPQGVFFMQMIGGVAELEASMITERVMTGKKQKATTGGYNGSQCPFGYDYDKASKVFTVNAHAPTVRFIFDRYLAGDSMHSIAKQLNESGKRTRLGAQWSQPTVRYVLLNGFYAGLAQWDGVEETGNHQAIIDLDTYHAATSRVEGAKRGNPNFGKSI